jgi:hypothetical protein
MKSPGRIGIETSESPEEMISCMLEIFLDICDFPQENNTSFNNLKLHSI